MTAVQARNAKHGDAVIYRRFPMVIVAKGLSIRIGKSGVRTWMDLAWPEQPERIVYRGVDAAFVRIPSY